MLVFAVSGFSFSGKTFLVEQLVGKLVSQGFTVATMKSTWEDIDAPTGTDTWRHACAGANPTVLLGPHSASVSVKGEASFSDFTKYIDTDYLILEGFKSLDVPRFWCIGEEKTEESFAPTKVMAYVVWEGTKSGPIGQDAPVVSNSKIDQILEIAKKGAVDIQSIAKNAKRVS